MSPTLFAVAVVPDAVDAAIWVYKLTVSLRDCSEKNTVDVYASAVAGAAGVCLLVVSAVFPSAGRSLPL